MKPLEPISLEKHAQLEQLRNLRKKKVFRYHTGGVEGVHDPLALTPLGEDEVDPQTLRKAPRKIPKSPYKVKNLQAVSGVDVGDRFWMPLL